MDLIILFSGFTFISVFLFSINYILMRNSESSINSRLEQIETTLKVQRLLEINNIPY